MFFYFSFPHKKKRVSPLPLHKHKKSPNPESPNPKPRLTMRGSTARVAAAALVLATIASCDAFAIGLRFNHTECFHKEISTDRALGGDGEDPDHGHGHLLPFTVVAAYVVSKDKADMDLDRGDDWPGGPKVEVEVTQPDGVRIFREDHAKSRGDVRVEGTGVGHYSICFTNVGKRGRWAWLSGHHTPDDEAEAFVRVLYFQPVHHHETEAADKLVKRHGPGAKDVAPMHPKGDKASGQRGEILHKSGAADIKRLALNLQDEISLMREELAYLKAGHSGGWLDVRVTPHGSHHGQTESE